jgi:hypothetical protein
MRAWRPGSRESIVDRAGGDGLPVRAARSRGRVRRRILVTVGILLLAVGALILLTPEDGSYDGHSCGSAPSVAVVLGVDTAAPGDGDWCRFSGWISVSVGTLMFVLPGALLLTWQWRAARRAPLDVPIWTPRSRSRTRRAVLMTIGVLLVGFGGFMVVAPWDGTDEGRSCGDAPSLALAVGIDTAAPGDSEWCRSQGRSAATTGAFMFVLPGALLLGWQYQSGRRAQLVDTDPTAQPCDAVESSRSTNPPDALPGSVASDIAPGRPPGLYRDDRKAGDPASAARKYEYVLTDSAGALVAVIRPVVVEQAENPAWASDARVVIKKPGHPPWVVIGRPEGSWRTRVRALAEPGMMVGYFRGADFRQRRFSTCTCGRPIAQCNCGAEEGSTQGRRVVGQPTRRFTLVDSRGQVLATITPRRATPAQPASLPQTVRNAGYLLGFPARMLACEVIESDPHLSPAQHGLLLALAAVTDPLVRRQVFPPRRGGL